MSEPAGPLAIGVEVPASASTELSPLNWTTICDASSQNTARIEFASWALSLPRIVFPVQAIGDVFTRQSSEPLLSPPHHSILEASGENAIVGLICPPT